MSRRVAYYPGCSLHGTAKELDASFRASLAAFDIQLDEIPGWGCCGNTAAHARSRLLAAALPYNELWKVKSNLGLDTVVVPCAACFSRFMVTLHDMQDERKHADIQRVVGRKFTGGVEVDNLVDVFYDLVGLEELERRMTQSLGGVKVAAYYGCLLTRPPKVTSAEDPEYPMHMDEILEVLGARPVDYSYKTDCCGASLALCEQSVVVELTRKILSDAAAAGADMVVCACPLCQANLDTRQEEIAAADPRFVKLPVLYLSQLVGLAVGVPAAKLGFGRHMVPVEPVLRGVGAAV
jgi:heterodisulfide reductase subunit B2